MDTARSHRPLKPRLCRSPQLTPARLAACRANARYARRLTRTLERASEHEQRTAERLARQVWCSGWKALEQVKANRGCY